MITHFFLILGTAITVIAIVVFIKSLANAPEGAEDESGFHCVGVEKVVQSRSFPAGSKTVCRPRVAKPLKAHIPAA